MNWISVNKQLPKLTKLGGFISEDVLFYADKSVYAGHFHKNGCFYGEHMAAHTPVALEQYGIKELPLPEATHWMPLPEPPKEKVG